MTKRLPALAAAMALAAVLLSACAGQSPPPFPVSPVRGPDSASTLVLQPGDMVRIQVFGRQELSGEFAVDENYNLLLPLLGEFSVRDMTVPALRMRVRAQYGDLFTQTFVSVVPLFRVAVLGEVVRPGLFSADPTMTVYDLLALAGGIVPTARTGDLHLIREGQTFSLRLDAAALAGATLRELGVRSGDQMIVPRKRFTTEVYVLILQLINTGLLAYTILAN
jgi:protein involved in polysaccharide export with SLBB domain